MNKIKVLVVEPNKEPYIQEIESINIKIYEFFNFYFEQNEIEKGVILTSSMKFTDLDYKKLLANRIYKDKIIYGSFIISGYIDNKEVSLTDEQINKYMNIFSLEKSWKI